MGYLNERVGKKNEGPGSTNGDNGEEGGNDNGWRIIYFCLIGNLVVTNEFFDHSNVI